ncbi:hypothetical protein [Rhodococcus sp. H29-C3]|uniref:DUF6924 domain-containing protein n=1 Tax=Rhodococcus sp. H29-C3 TaxID=3046307 RepID=UPI0024BAC5C7|nr:hypothetical protein [Rhodococcus sp. H29-C3]MDJ0362756.1 hypothetical protein [Rhodococcus sp. H29-C3]
MSVRLPQGQSLLVRTDFNDDVEWATVIAQCTDEYRQSDGSTAQASLTVVDDRDFESTSSTALAQSLPDDASDYLFVADNETFDDSEHLILVVKVSPNTDQLETFRVTPAHLAEVENNLSIANLDFDEFVSATDDFDVFRGFESPAERTEITVTKKQLTDAAQTNTSTPTLERFYRAALDYVVDVLPPAPLVPNLRANYDYVAATDYSYSHEVAGREEYLEASKNGGSGIGLTMPISNGYWQAILDPETLQPRATMLVQMRPPPTVRAH